MSYAIRVTRSYDDVFTWVDNLKCSKLAVYEHEADDEISRTHIHMIIYTDLKPDAMKARYKKLYGEIDKSDWSFKKADDDGFITYMSKGHLPPKLAKGYEVSEIERLTQEWKEPERKTKVVLENGKLVRDIETVPKKTKSQMLEQMRSRLSDSSTTRDKLSAIRKVLMLNNEVIGQYKVMDYYDSLMMYYYKEDWMFAMEKKINSKYEV